MLKQLCARPSGRLRRQPFGHECGRIGRPAGQPGRVGGVGEEHWPLPLVRRQSRGTLEPHCCCRIAHRGRMGLYGDDQEVAFDTLLEAARLFEDEDPSRAAELLADAIGAGLQVGGASAAEAAARLGALRANDDAVRELLIAQGLLAAGPWLEIRGDGIGSSARSSQLRLRVCSTNRPCTCCGRAGGGSC
jgi:hypothetical protein